MFYPDNVGTFPFTTQYHFYLISSVPLFDVCAGVSHQFVRFYFIAKSVLIHLPEWYFRQFFFKEKFSKFFVDNSYMYLYTTTSINTSFPWCPPKLTFCLLRCPIFYYSNFLHSLSLDLSIWSWGFDTILNFQHIFGFIIELLVKTIKSTKV